MPNKIVTISKNQDTKRLTLIMLRRENKAQHNLKWPFILDHSFRVLILSSSGSGKINTLLNLINHQPNIDKMYLYAKDTSKAKHKLLIKNVNI